MSFLRVGSTSFPGSLILPLAPGGKMRDPGNEVGVGCGTFHVLLDLGLVLVTESRSPGRATTLAGTFVDRPLA